LAVGNLHVYAWWSYAHTDEYVHVVDVWYGSGECMGSEKVPFLLQLN